MSDEINEAGIPLSGVGQRGNGLGIVALKDGEKFSDFRDTLKNLLNLANISQDQMRERLLMLADLPTDYVALDARRILGEEYEQLKRERDDLKQFKSHQQEVQQLCDCSSLTAWRDRTSAHLIYFSVLKPSPGCCGRRRNPV